MITERGPRSQTQNKVIPEAAKGAKGDDITKKLGFL